MHIPMLGKYAAWAVHGVRGEQGRRPFPCLFFSGRIMPC